MYGVKTMKKHRKFALWPRCVVSQRELSRKCGDAFDIEISPLV
ncbi:hypothetical protein HMPREF1870_00146 [Bacteroidales bacterium KA00344]|nr:hypothetical protein HMPREF1870_00146 [Bacteroidales bacterium KA00344]